ncbi:glycoside hydrolase family 127 protein [Paenibacillus arenilitoris]|uniref:Glycoside hydrolase family 127 protein n=1 Tax=Paenibacillus arenilitoris TaxID=2772299 RepID=A0A927CP66_9BACL|nr:beta-L-arabinofuranosidase domain-containing protein [Paenibacillus arenilitoris]MBD2871678.1 glycoside hydrolase family 127 protein [Paenibacillus arenilitoris]
MLNSGAVKGGNSTTTFKHQRIRNLPVGAATITDGFWSPKLEVLRNVTAHDVLNKFESDGALRNFDFVSEGKGGYHSGEPWFDGLIYETIRGISDILAVRRDEALDRRVDAIIEKVARAQRAVGDGYINTYTLLDRPNQRWGDNGGNLRWQHDVYNAGCLVEAGVHHYKATGKTTLLVVAVRFANHMSELMGPPPKRNIVPAHSLPEEALLKLHQLAVDEPELAGAMNVPFEAQAYLELVTFWIGNRGRFEDRPAWGEYAQDHKPVLEQDEAVGHAVRATLLYTGLTALHLATGQENYLETAKKLWDNIAYRKSHISGGVGAVHEEEKFGRDYELPDNGYLETCAAVGMGYFSWNLFLATGEGRYIDALENIVYNILLAGRSMNGHKYFYENPLVSNGGHNRWEWHSCPCCPPMIVKMLPELSAFIYACDEGGAFVNLYIEGEAGMEIGGMGVKLAQRTAYPWDGSVDLSVSPEREARFQVRLRIPGWCGKHVIRVNGEAAEYRVDNGYAVLERQWTPGDVIRLELDMPVDLIEAHPNVTTHANKVAIKRGPMLYCLESMDNERYAIKRGMAQYTRESLNKGKGLKRQLPERPAFETEFVKDFFDGAVIVRTQDADNDELLAIPYPYWNNRSRGAMNIWLQYEKPSGLEGWENRLYRKVPAGPDGSN